MPFGVRSVRRSHSIGIFFVWMKPPVTLVERVFLWSQIVGMIFILKSIPFSARFFVSIVFNHSIINSGSRMNRSWILWIFVAFLQLVSRMVFLVSRLLTISTSVRPSFLDDVLRNWKKGTIYAKWYHCASKRNIFCTALWVIRCSQHPESFFLILCWQDYMIDLFVDLIEEHVDLGGFQFSDSIDERSYYARISERNVVCLLRSPSLNHDSRHDQQRIFQFFYIVLHHQRWACRLHDKLESRSAVWWIETDRPDLSWVCSHWDSSCVQKE